MPGPTRLVTQLGTPLDQEVRDLYAFTNASKFAHLSDQELAKHITEVRDKAYKIAPWPCLGAFRFLIPGISQAGPAHVYHSIVDYLVANPKAKVLDLGCCFGHDARQLVKDGVKPDQVVACDLLPELIDYGYELFGDEKDKGHLKGMTWEKVDVFNQEDIDRITQPDGYHAIYIGSFIHLFPLSWQHKVVANLNQLLSKDPGSKVWGRQVGVENGCAGPRDRIQKGSRGPVGIEDNPDGSRESPYYHDSTSLKELFEKGTSQPWDGQVVLYDWNVERGSDMMSGDGASMIDPVMAQTMKRLSFAFVRK